MKEVLKKIASKYSVEKISELNTAIVDKIYSIAKKNNVYVNENDIMKAVESCMNNEGIMCEAENKDIFVVNTEKFNEKIANKIWSDSQIINECIKIAAEKPIKIEYIPSKYEVTAGEDGKFGVPGWKYCGLWNVISTHTVTIGGYVIPQKFLGQAQPIQSRQTLFGTTEE